MKSLTLFEEKARHKWINNIEAVSDSDNRALNIYDTIKLHHQNEKLDARKVTDDFENKSTLITTLSTSPN